jgi:hypothetical protein
MKIKALLVAFCMLLAGAVAAAAIESPVIVVEGVQMPAWVEHASGARDPLVIGMRLVNSDRIYTGPGSRALLKLVDGSQIKLGENGILALDDLGKKKIQMKDLVTASLDVVKGAFRFTTQALTKFRGERDVKVRIVTITAGIRGTDLWGKADDTRDIVCLIEGNVTVVRAEEAFTMNEPMSFYIAPKNQQGQPVAKVSQEQLNIWSAETEIAAGKGAIRKGGKWRVYLAEAGTQDEALKVYDDLRNAGYAAEIRPAKKEDAMVFRVRISNLMSKKEAEILGAALKGKYGVTEPRVSQ